MNKKIFVSCVLGFAALMLGYNMLSTQPNDTDNKPSQTSGSMAAHEAKMIVRPCAQLALTAEITAATQTYEAGWNQLLAGASSSPDAFIIDNAHDTLLHCVQGTVVRMPANALETADGKKPEGHVKITVKECYNLTDILANKLGTTCDGKLIESAGMVDIKATANGEELKVKEGMTYDIAMPDNGSGDGYQVFYGERDEAGVMDWEVDSASKVTSSVAASTAGPPDPFYILGGYYKMNGGGCDIGIVKHQYTEDGRRYNMHDTSLQLENEQNLLAYIDSMYEPPARIRNEVCWNNSPFKVRVHLTRDGKMEEPELKHVDNREYHTCQFDLLEETPPVDTEKFMTEYKSDSYLTFTFANRITTPITYEWIEGDTVRKADYENNRGLENLEATKASEMNYYLIRANKLGWINCDRFMNSTARLTDVFVDAGVTDGCTVVAVMDNYNSIVYGTLVGKLYAFYNLPVGEAATIIALKGGDMPLMGKKHCTIDQEVKVIDEFQRFGIKDLEKELSVPPISI